MKSHVSLGAIKFPMFFGVLLFGLSFFGASSGVVSLPEVSLKWDLAQSPGYTPSFETKSGPELALIYIGSAGCGASNRAYLPEMIEALKLKIQQKANESGRSFAAIGIAKDWVAEDGIAHLEKFGRFDETMAGRNWLNAGVLKYIWQDLPGVAATPQVLIVNRLVDDRSSDRPGAGFSIREEQLVVRKIETDEIRQWFEQGAPLPTLTTLEPLEYVGNAANLPFLRPAR